MHQQSLGLARQSFRETLETIKSKSKAIFINPKHQEVSRVLVTTTVLVSQKDIKRIETALLHLNNANSEIKKAQAALWSFNALNNRNLSITQDLTDDYINALTEIVQKALERRAAMLAEKAAA